jgi:hypothetical protein
MGDGEMLDIEMEMISVGDGEMFDRICAKANLTFEAASTTV